MSLVVEADPEVLLAALHREFPGVVSWRGEFTGTWWALLGDRLVEAPTARELAASIRQTLLPSWPPLRRPLMDVRPVQDEASSPPVVRVAARLVSAEVPSARTRVERYPDAYRVRGPVRRGSGRRVFALVGAAAALVGAVVAWDVVSVLCG
ncbi:hypothetical protein [Actinomadura harenae]|uniref:Uncharacterized protein n=1 Tax=Actinomadura harenae TaxID=2483351 RepID=A0A3M2M611_9ACTN|nr:hypothetical protein [Actinomadura harenae]RMI45117.1 hypothetical protein EBO15_11160 [Actinomadura harenae]